MKKYFTKVQNPIKVQNGDIIILPYELKNQFALTPNSLSKLGVSHGFTSRSYNTEKTIRELLTEAFDPTTKQNLAFVITETRVRRYYDESKKKLSGFFGNEVASTIDADNIIEYARLYPISEKILKGAPLKELTDKILTVNDNIRKTLIAIGYLCNGDNLPAVTPFSIFSTIGGIKCGDIGDTKYDGSDREYNFLVDVCPKARVSDKSIIPYVNYSLYYQDDLVTAEKFEDAFVDQIFKNYRYTANKDNSLYVGQKFLETFANRGAILLRPTAAFRSAILSRAFELIAEVSADRWNTAQHEIRKVIQIVNETSKRLSVRSKNWKKFAVKSAKAARSYGCTTTGISKALEGVLP